MIEQNLFDMCLPWIQRVIWFKKVVYYTGYHLICTDEMNYTADVGELIRKNIYFQIACIVVMYSVGQVKVLIEYSDEIEH